MAEHPHALDGNAIAGALSDLFTASVTLSGRCGRCGSGCRIEQTIVVPSPGGYAVSCATCDAPLASLGVVEGRTVLRLHELVETTISG